VVVGVAFLLWRAQPLAPEHLGSPSEVP
jgi:hypothetical protein